MKTRKPWRAVGALALGVALAAPPCKADNVTGRLQNIDSLNPTQFFVLIQGYGNPSCDNARILMEDPDTAYRDRMFTMLYGAFLTGATVYIEFTVSGGQCRGHRVIVTL